MGIVRARRQTVIHPCFLRAICPIFTVAAAREPIEQES